MTKICDGERHCQLTKSWILYDFKLKYYFILMSQSKGKTCCHDALIIFCLSVEKLRWSWVNPAGWAQKKQLPNKHTAVDLEKRLEQNQECVFFSLTHTHTHTHTNSLSRARARTHSLTEQCARSRPPAPRSHSPELNRLHSAFSPL